MTHDHGFASVLDAAVLVRAQRGDNAAFESIYRLYERPAYRLAVRILGRPAAAEDAVHDAFVRAFEKLGGYRGEAPFGAWMKRLVANAAIDRLRGEQRWSGDDEAVQWLVDEGPESHRQIDAGEALARLPARARSVVWLHAMEGYSHAEIAALFRQTESWSKSTLARSLERLRRHIEEGMKV